MMSMGLQSCGMDPSEYDPHILVGEHVICVVYVNDFSFFSKEDNYIDALVEKMCDHKFELEY